MTPYLAQRHALSTLTLALLAACGSGGEPPRVAISGVVADGPLSGVTVCYDLNDNEACDTDEPASALTDADGKFRLLVDESVAGRHAVLALVPASAIDKDSGAAVGAALTLKSPATGTTGEHAVFVSPLTTAVADLARQSGKTTAEAAQQVQDMLGLGTSALANFAGNSDSGAAQAAVAARALTGLMVEATRLSTAAGVQPADAGRLARAVASGGLPALGNALAANTAAPVAERVAHAVATVSAEFNLSADTVQRVAEAVSRPLGVAVRPGPFVSLRRLAYTDANNYSYAVFTGDSGQTGASGEFVAHEARKAVGNGADQPYNRNQMYWTGTAWSVCPLQWEVSLNKLDTATGAQSGLYCGASRSETSNTYEDISGQTLRDVVARMRQYPLADTVGAHTNADGLPTRWGPDPTLLPADAVFPAGSVLNARRQLADIGGVDRIELTTKSTVRWPDGVFRQATTLEQYGSMAGDLLDPNTAATGGNTVFVNDLPLAEQPDVTLEAFKRWRAGLDIGNLRARFYQCAVRKSDQSSLNCTAAGDATLAITTQGGIRLLRFASGYPVALSSKLRTQRFWAEHSGTVFRGARDLGSTRHEQRLNGPAWAALRTALGIAEHTPPAPPAGPGPAETLRGFTYTDAGNYNWRSFAGDNSQLDAAGYFMTNEVREIRSNGQLTPFARNQLLWTGSEWYDCPSDGVGVIRSNSVAPHDSAYCRAYLDERYSSVVLTLAGRRMADVVNDIRSFGSLDGSFDYAGWGPSPAAHTVLATAAFPAGSTMEYRGNLRKATPLIIGTAAGNQLRVAPAPNTTAAFNTWPFASSLEDLIAKYPGDWKGGTLNGNVAQYVHGITLSSPPLPEFNRTFEIRVAFDAEGQKARFYSNNRTAANNFTTNYTRLLDTTYSIETVGGLRLLKFAAMPEGFESRYIFQRLYAERDGGVWYAWKDAVPATPMYSIRLNGTAALALGQALGIR